MRSYQSLYNFHLETFSEDVAITKVNSLANFCIPILQD